MVDMKRDSALLISRTVKGYAFRDLPQSELDMIASYQDSGDPNVLDAGYRRLRDGWFDCMTDKQRYAK
ncbi:hypothetical protein PBI_ARISSANAE_94 [Mycobacterium phage Arissanae]|nr:hypothetical protein PBI_ARISSANAE_94 [Mycobacterium phage Arissanae]